MASIRNLNNPPGNPISDFLSSFNVPEHTPNHPFFAAFNPEARHSGPPPPFPGAGDNNDDPPEVPPPSHEEGRGPGHHRGPPPWARRGCGGRGGWGGPRRGGGRCGGGGGGLGGMNFGNFDMRHLGELISQFVPAETIAAFGAAASREGRDGATSNNNNNNSTSEGNPKDFSPAADVFDTPDAYIIHISLPGAKKEDVGVNWDADRSELSVAGVISRPGDEEFLKSLALDERKEVGVFERKVKLGSREEPASVDVDGIGAKMEDGILRVTIPKVETFVEVKKVDIE